jgi:hypothetical protein
MSICRSGKLGKIFFQTVAIHANYLVSKNFPLSFHENAKKTKESGRKPAKRTFEKYSSFTLARSDDTLCYLKVCMPDWGKL